MCAKSASAARVFVIHNELDFRCLIGQGHELFTTPQRLRVPSKMVNFPDEDHWVMKPKNGAFSPYPSDRRRDTLEYTTRRSP